MSKPDTRPSDKDHDVNSPLPEHDYDGIHEENNPLPKWWNLLFVLTIVFAVVYLPVVHVLNFLPRNELQQDIATAAYNQEQRELALEASGALDKDPVAAGQKNFKTFCVSCHGGYAEGGLCPNLTDAYWIHSPYVDSIRTVITNGVPSKGMPTWGPVLGERKIKNLTAYMETLWQTKPPVPGKKPEGTQYDMAAIRGSSNSVVAAVDTVATKK